MANKEYVDLADLALYKQLWGTRRNEIIEDGTDRTGDDSIRKLFSSWDTGYLVAYNGGIIKTNDFIEYETVFYDTDNLIYNIGKSGGTYYGETPSFKVCKSNDLKEWTIHSPTYNVEGVVARSYFIEHNGTFYNINKKEDKVFYCESPNGYEWNCTEIIVPDIEPLYLKNSTIGVKGVIHNGAQKSVIAILKIDITSYVMTVSCNDYSVEITSLQNVGLRNFVLENESKFAITTAAGDCWYIEMNQTGEITISKSPQKLSHRYELLCAGKKYGRGRNSNSEFYCDGEKLIFPEISDGSRVSQVDGIVELSDGKPYISARLAFGNHNWGMFKINDNQQIEFIGYIFGELGIQSVEPTNKKVISL